MRLYFVEDTCLNWCKYIRKAEAGFVGQKKILGGGVVWQPVRKVFYSWLKDCDFNGRFITLCHLWYIGIGPGLRAIQYREISTTHLGCVRLALPQKSGQPGNSPCRWGRHFWPTGNQQFHPWRPWWSVTWEIHGFLNQESEHAPIESH